MIAALTRADDGAARLGVRVRPNAPRCALSLDPEGVLRAAVDAPPDDGRANRRLVRYLAREVLHVPQADVRVVRGARSRDKTVEIRLDVDEVSRRLSAALRAGDPR